MNPLPPNEYYRAERSPYYIVAPNYRGSSSGIRVLHYLCHTLNLQGYEAYVQASSINDELWTPLLDEKIMRQHYVARRKPIVIYPEVVSGTPLGLGIKVRYLLNKPGFIAGHKDFEEDEILVAYREAFIADSGAEEVLLLPACDPGRFNPEGTKPEERHGRYFYYNRLLSRGGQLQSVTESATEISPAKPRSLEELATIFRQAELLYCYEDSAATVEARMCGCPVVYIPNPTMLPAFPSDSFGRDGIAWGVSDEEIRHAKATVHKVYPTYQKLYKTLHEQLVRFISLTQKAAHDTPFNKCYPAITVNKKGWPLYAQDQSTGLPKLVGLPDKNYQAWLKRTSLQEIDGQLLAERMMKKWKLRPKFNILIEAREGEENLLADSIDSIATQWYADWHLTLITDFEPADPSLAELEQITWLVRQEETSRKTIIDQTISQIPCDWLLLLEPGNTIEPHTLAYFADTINLQPSSRLIYCDEDVRTEAGDQVAPRFKPDINLELLRNMYYLGPALAIQRQAFEQAGGWSCHEQAPLYDIALRLLDFSGIEAITHQRDMLLHSPEKCLRSIDSKAEQACLREHLARRSINGEIQSGFLHGTQKLTYPPQGSPLISIIIPTRDQPGYLSHCIDSIASQTLYPHWELILVDHGTQDPDALNYISNLLDASTFVQRVDAIRAEGEFNYARLCNLGVSLAKGEFLLFLDNDTEIIQPSWLGDLLGYLQQPDVAAVAPRLSQPDGSFSLVQSGPRMLGVAGLANGMASTGTSLIEPGYCGRLQVAQDASALIGSCLMVSAKEFHLAGKFNEIDTPVYESALELCIQLTKNGQRLIWSPWVDVVHHDGITRKRLENIAHERTQLTAQALFERDHFYNKHLSTLASDPYYHHHLSLNAAFTVEPNAVIDWDTRFHDRLRILGQPLTSGSGEYRMVAPFRALQKTGLAQTNIVHPVSQKVQRVLTPVELARSAPDVLLLQQAIDDNQINQLKRYRHFAPDIFVAYAVDDVLGNLPRKHYLYNYQAREGKSRMREGLALCNRLIASTPPIADYCKDMIDDIVVVPNRLESALWGNLVSQRGTGKKPRVGWAGAQQHLGDLELIQKVVEALADEVEWVFMGMCPDFLKPYVAEEHAFVSFRDYPAKLASLNLDLAIAPLEQHLFNEGKSNLRLLEYGAMGWPVICTDIYPYQTNNAPVKRLPNDEKMWIEAIRERIHDLDATYKEGDALKAWVQKHYMLEDHIEEWLQALTPPNR